VLYRIVLTSRVGEIQDRAWPKTLAAAIQDIQSRIARGSAVAGEVLDSDDLVVWRQTADGRIEDLSHQSAPRLRGLAWGRAFASPDPKVQAFLAAQKAARLWAPKDIARMTARPRPRLGPPRRLGSRSGARGQTP
jgi:hypothetical protein